MGNSATPSHFRRSVTSWWPCLQSRAPLRAERSGGHRWSSGDCLSLPGVLQPAQEWGIRVRWPGPQSEYADLSSGHGGLG